MRPVTRAVRATCLVAVAAMSLVGCTGAQQQPREYGEVTEDGTGYFGNFMYGCTGVEEPNGEGIYEDPTLASDEFCRCVFAGMKETVPFDDAKQFEEDQAETPEGETIEVPRAIQAVMDSCRAEQPAEG